MENQPENNSGWNAFETSLNLALLEDETLLNEETLETMAQQVFAAAPAVALHSAKENELIQKLSSQFSKKQNRFWLNTMLLVLLLGGTTAAYFTFRNSNAVTASNDPENQKIVPALIAAKPDYESNEALPVLKKEEEKEEDVSVIPLAFSDSAKQKNILLQQPAASFYASTFSKFYIPEDNDLPYEELPALNDAEKKQTAKDKLKILKEIARKKSYLLLPAGATNVNGKLTAINYSFYEKGAEVTNFEYRTFLNDLLVEGKADEYLLARPVKGNWKTIGIPEFEETYFTSLKYNDFPAVNMTRKGAELYCEWLTRSMQAAITNKEVKWPEKTMPDFRLPNSAEWIYAARACDTTVTLPWGKLFPDSTQNRKGCFLCNFNYDLSKDKVKPQCPYYVKFKKTGKTHSVVTTAGLAIDTLLTAPVYSYNPNGKGLYCTMGNVSEMVWTYMPENTSANGPARSMGGNWNSYVDNVRIESKEEYVGMIDASPMIGFRPVMILK